MPVDTDFVKYHRSIADELKATQDRVRNLIGSSHWGTDGEHKEAVLRKTLRSCLPESLHVGRGFVCYEWHSSTQLDVLITNKNRATLFQEGDLVIVTPDCVEAIVEVKTKLEPSKLTETLTKLADQAGEVRWKKPGRQCWAGLFVFDGPEGVDADEYGHKSRKLLKAIAKASEDDHERAVNCVALGSELFVRYWPDTIPGAHMDVRGWQAYVFNEGPHASLAPAYFVSNLVWQISPDTSAGMKYAWFPIPKEEYRIARVALGSSEVSFYQRTYAT